MAECKNIMVYVETAEGNPVKVGLEMLSPAKKLADKVTAVVIGGGNPKNHLRSRRCC